MCALLVMIIRYSLRAEEPVRKKDESNSCSRPFRYRHHWTSQKPFQLQNFFLASHPPILLTKSSDFYTLYAYFFLTSSANYVIFECTRKICEVTTVKWRWREKKHASHHRSIPIQLSLHLLIWDVRQLNVKKSYSSANHCWKSNEHVH